MAIDFCNLCNDPCINNGNIGNNSMQEVWRTLVAQALCNLNQVLAAPVVTLPEYSLDYEVLDSNYVAYGSISFLNGHTKLKRLRVINDTDAAIEISFDAGVTTFMTVNAGVDTGFLNLGNIVVSDPADMYIQLASGQTPTVGSVTFQGSY